MINARELATLHSAMSRSHAAGETPAVVTLLRVDGSAYRRPGAKMLVQPDGVTTCMISGGCLEPELAEIAKDAIAQGTGRRVRYDLSEDEVWGLGLGCGGAIDLYIEPLKHDSEAAKLIELQAAGERAVLATVFPEDERHAPLHRLYRETAAYAGRDRDCAPNSGAYDEAFSSIEGRARELLAGDFETSRLETIAGAEVFFDLSRPVPDLVLFGGGAGAVPLASYAERLGFAVTVVDPRPAVANRESFPSATIVAAHPEQYRDSVEIAPHSTVVIMNHHLERDREALVFALERKPAYLGMLGPRRRFEKVLAALEVEGRRPPAEETGRVQNPVGLDIGAEGPEEIAISILAEILAERRGHGGARLSDKRAGIHERSSVAETAAIATAGEE